MENQEKQKKKDNFITFNYVKSREHRIFHSDGFFGGLTPKGKIYMEPYVEMMPTPKGIKHKISPEGNLERGKTSGQSGVFDRNIECGIIMDIETARRLVSWLSNKIKSFEELKEQEERQEE